MSRLRYLLVTEVRPIPSMAIKVIAAGASTGFSVLHRWLPSSSLTRIPADSCSLGVDLARAGMGLKAYFIPHVRSRMTKKPVIDIVTHTINDLRLGLPWSKATSYFSTLPQEYKVEPVIVAVDCVPEAENRFKVYVRTQATHLSALLGMLSLGGQLKGPAIDATLAKLRELWHVMFGPISDDTPVKHQRSNTGPTGFLFYYEMALGSDSPIPKIYIPAARFLDNDARVSQVVSQFVGSGYTNDIRTLL